MGNNTIKFRAFGDFACFSHPEFSVERFSYPWITPSAARGLIESVYWHPEIRYEIRKICVLNPINYINIMRNGTEYVGKKSYSIDEKRQQFNSSILCNVDYIISVKIICIKEEVGKHLAILQRRLHKGQRYRSPYFGCREFVADICEAPSENSAINCNIDYGLMLYDFIYKGMEDKFVNIDFSKIKLPQPIYFNAKIESGIVSVPRFEDCTYNLPKKDSNDN